ncbi:MAG: hypothetical protein MK212_22330, partial [Saprospiraceae bacterium]|nr:hypothetical protein [Saprospiraceae bacterium]
FEGEIHIKLHPMSMRLEKMSFTPSINFTVNTEGMGGLSVDVGASMDLESDYAEGVAGDTVSTTTGNAEAHLTVAMFDQELSLSVERSASNSDWLYEVKKEGDELLLEALRKTYRQLSSETNIDNNFNIYRYVDRFDQIFEQQWEEGKARIKERENLTIKDELVDLTFYQRAGGIYEIATQASIINSVVGSCKICKGVHELILFDQNKVFLDGVYESTAGTWSASIEMKQSGNKITGKYSKGSLEGTVSAIRIAGTWEENGLTGRFQFQIQENGQVLDGTYSTDGSSGTKPWMMTRK